MPDGVVGAQSLAGLAMAPVKFEEDPKARYSGTVDFYNKWKGYGFICLAQKGVVPDDRIFAHWRNIQSEDRFPFLVKGLEVEFGVMKWREQGPFTGWKTSTTLRAKTITLPGGGSLMLQDSLDAEKKTFVGGQNLRYTGILKFYDQRKGFGYITMDPGFEAQVKEGVSPELRVERAEMNAAGKQPGWMENIAVEFGIWKTSRGGHEAYNVTLPGGIPMTQAALEHRAVVAGLGFMGEVKIWNWRQGYGFIKLSPACVMPPHVQAQLSAQTMAIRKRAQEKGREASQEELIYFRRQDLKPSVRIKTGDEVRFQLYTDDTGVGAYDIE